MLESVHSRLSCIVDSYRSTDYFTTRLEVEKKPPVVIRINLPSVPFSCIIRLKRTTLKSPAGSGNHICTPLNLVSLFQSASVRIESLLFTETIEIFWETIEMSEEEMKLTAHVASKSLKAQDQ